MEENRTKTNENKIEGRNAVLEAFRSGKPVDKLYVLDGCQDGPVRTIIREARKHDTLIQFVEKRTFISIVRNRAPSGASSPLPQHMNILKYPICWNWHERKGRILS